MNNNNSDPFSNKIPMQVWISVFSYLSISDRRGKKTHHSLSLVSKAAHQITNHDLIWKVRLSLLAIHYGYCYFNDGNENEEDDKNDSQDEAQGLLSYLQKRQKELAQSKDRNNNKPSLLSALTLPLVGSQKIKTKEQDAMSIFWDLKLRRRFVAAPKQDHRRRMSSTATMMMRANTVRQQVEAENKNNVEVFDEDDAPIAFSVFVPESVFPDFNWKTKFLHLHFIATMKCCVCGTQSVSRMSPQDDVRKGLEFFFPSSMEKMIVNNFTDNKISFEDRIPNADVRESITRQMSNTLLPWSGLRICSNCIALLNLAFVPPVVSSAPSLPLTASRRRREDVDNNGNSHTSAMSSSLFKKSLGPVALLPVDFDIVKSKSRKAGDDCDGTDGERKAPLGQLVLGDEDREFIQRINELKLNRQMPCDPLGLISKLLNDVGGKI